MSLLPHRLSAARRRIVALALAGAALAPGIGAQERLPQPWDSPEALVSQTIGISQVTVTYFRPAVKGRTIWGDLVPYGEVWRAGANTNTVVTFSDAVQVEGQPLGAGSYGLHMVPEQGQWTVIFSHNSTSWGSFAYRQDEDALRVKVAPRETPFTEWLTYGFEELSSDTAALTLSWDRLAVPVHLRVNTQELVLANARDAYLRGTPGFSWQGWDNAARYCLRNKVDLEEGLAWSRRSTAIATTMTNLTTQAGLLELLGRTAEAAAAREQVLAVATEVELNALGYQYLRGDQLDKALDAFRANVAAHPESWNAHDSLAEALQVSGDTAQAIEQYRLALALAPDDSNRERIAAALQTLGAP